MVELVVGVKLVVMKVERVAGLLLGRLLERVVTMQRMVSVELRRARRKCLVLLMVILLLFKLLGQTLVVQEVVGRRRSPPTRRRSIRFGEGPASVLAACQQRFRYERTWRRRQDSKRGLSRQIARSVEMRRGDEAESGESRAKTSENSEWRGLATLAHSKHANSR